MQIRCFDSFDSLRAARPALAAMPAATPFRTLDWFEHLAQQGMTDDPQLQLLTTDSPDAKASCLPLVCQSGGVSSLSNYYSGLYGPVGAGDGDATSWFAIARHLRRSRPGIVRLHPLDTDGRFYTEMRAALAAAGFWVDHYFCFGNWYMRPDAISFDDYLSARPAALRNTVRRGRGKLNKAGDWQLVIHTTLGTTLEQAIADYEGIYRRSWKPAEGHPEFVRGLCRMAAANGWLRLGVLSLQGKPIASQIWLFMAGTAYIFKLAYDPDAARFSPGSVLTAGMMEQAIDKDRATEIDYLSGDDDYKQDWMTHRRERHGLIAFDPATWRGLAAGTRHFAGRLVKQLLGRRPT